MNMPTEEELEAHAERAKALCARITQLLMGTNDHDARAALAAAVAQRCLAHDNPDRAFLETVDAALAVFREASNIQYRNEDPAVS